jgi:hypothetical protein
MSTQISAPRDSKQSASEVVPANQHDWTTRCLQLAAAAAEAKLQKVFLRMARSFQVDAALLAMSRSTIAESRRLLAKSWSERVDGGQDDSLTNSREKIAESRRLLATLELSPSTANDDEAAHGEPTLVPAAPIAPNAAAVLAKADRDPAALSVHVFQEGARFGWTICSPSEVVLGQGTAETELKARADAFGAGMIYLDWLKDRHRSDDGRIH